MYCLLSLPRAGSIAACSWIMEALGEKYPEYKEPRDLIFSQANDPRLFKNVFEVFEEINIHNPMFTNVHRHYNDLEQSLLPYNYNYDFKLYHVLTSLSPLPVVSLKVGKSYGIMDSFIQNSKYKTIVLTRKNLKQQFLSFIVSTQTQTFHGNQDSIFTRRANFEKIEVHPAMFAIWFDWLFRLHRLKMLTKHTFYIEDLEKDPNFFLKSIGLPSIEKFDNIIQKTKNTDFIKYIKNPDVFEKTWNEYQSIYRGII
jgi:hypothetical protein